MFNYDKLQLAIKKSGKTKTYLCEQLGRPPYYLRDVIKQKNQIPIEFQNILAKELSVSVSWLNDEEENKNPAPTNEDGLSETKRDAIRKITNASDEEVARFIKILEALQK